ncbi:tumor necrosis factor receptor superfamily member 1A [Anabas testudineus]|uniref:tumor necrosis factor receptor superfamily member 1A n=1 Tax=Anabas testudineus TaxID=64144 RepID=UPI000E460507|nr:tumor necrosis factor receptor superfamily member 1A [Anabas testudineus]
MEGHRGRRNKKAPAGIMLILMCMLTFTLTSSCPHGDYLSTQGICCNKCPPGFKLVEECRASGHRSNCTPCPEKQYNDQINYADNCKSCTRCKASRNEREVSSCEKNKNTVCQCKDGYYKSVISPDTYECLKCKVCAENEVEKQECTTEMNTQCECKENYYKMKNKCVQCKNCTTQCSHHCLTPTTPKTSRDHATPSQPEILGSIISGVVVSAFVLSLVVLITYWTTKQHTKKKFKNVSSEQPAVFQESCKVLISSEESWIDHNVKAVPQSPLNEQLEPSNLPDCVPQEINIPDLIYTVLDLVPVQQVKQLVRTLGVKDIEIEQAEMDHRSCREAHYQMLRVWAERGSHAGRGGRGRMLHCPLLKELLEQLRKLHLGRAAEELETKYGIQH